MMPKAFTNKPLEPVAIHRAGGSAFGNREPETRPLHPAVTNQDREMAITMTVSIGEDAAVVP